MHAKVGPNLNRKLVLDYYVGGWMFECWREATGWGIEGFSILALGFARVFRVFAVELKRGWFCCVV